MILPAKRDDDGRSSALIYDSLESVGDASFGCAVLTTKLQITEAGRELADPAGVAASAIRRM